jgi:hypothetical protein
VIAAAHWRRGGPDGREPIAAAGEVVSLAKNYTKSQEYWGKVTSSRPAPLTASHVQLVAFRLGCSFDTARRAILMGLVK